MERHYSIKSIHEFAEDDFNKVVAFYPECFSGTITLSGSKLLNNGDISVMTVTSGDECIFFCLLHPDKNNIYISDVCVRKAWRGKGVMESAFKYITDYYGKKGKYYLTLTASNENNQGLNQQKRIQIFNKHHFYLSPLHIASSGYGSDNLAPISVALSNGKRVNIKSGPLKKEGLKSKYLAKDSLGNEFHVSMDQIEACFTKSLFGENKVHCPMKKSLKPKRKGGLRRITAKSTVKYRN